MTQHSFSPTLYTWLTADGSLTTLLEAKAGQSLQVKRTFEGYRPLSLSQKKQLGMTGYQLNRPLMAWVREVQLYGNSPNAWILAQSVFPITCLQGNAKRLQQLKDTPIGYVLFDRQPSLPNQRSIEQTEQGWRRQTVYDWYGRIFMISETFLPEFLK
ncbi:chorismate--pyruvate lyase family protein [Psychrobacter sp. I-STPA6b]|uniref:chorismate--pyruvate lyase family protein n=1 Tax=Psychrobacter sp. I-STPA6b TaxID=2585718 RepID=UPI001D0C8156|nr:chorismate lyase [Psychrobacter sp. I-STPA6b]